VHNIALSWQQAGVLSGALFAVALALHLARGQLATVGMPIARESGIIAGLYALWQLAGTLSVLGTSGAFSRARWIVRVEHDVGLPSEASVQRGVAAHPLFIQACNLYYASMHFAVMFAFLAWLFLRHRDRYGSIRATLAVSTLVCLLVQLIPVAPPRLLPGFTDTAREYGQSVYSLGLAPDQLSAMPSVHVCWAVLVAWAVIHVSSSRWRWLIVVHPVLTMLAITATANHFWLDGIVAVAVLVACRLAQLGATRAVSHWRAAPTASGSAELAAAVR
jgi:hypothetical protein